jgi:hypothetical protein
MKSLLIGSLSFAAGMLIGGLLIAHAFASATRNLSLDAVAERAVKDMSTAYEGALNKSGLVEKLSGKFDECVRSNSTLQKRIWRLENPEHPCIGKGCEVY